MDVATAVANNGAIGVAVPPSLTKDEGAYVSALVAFDGACVSVFADGAGHLGEHDDVESAGGQVGHEDRGPVDLIVASKAIVVLGVIVVIVVITVVVVFVSRDVAAEDGVSGAVPSLLSLLSSGAAAAALYLIQRLLNVGRSIIAPSHPDCFATPFSYYHHRPPIRAPPTTFLCRLLPLLTA